MESAAATYRKTAKTVGTENLILNNMDFVGRILSTMSIGIQNPDERENLKSAGVLGLVEAAHSFDPSRGVPFRTFAFTRIRGAIYDELRKLSPVSQQVLRQIGLLKKAYEKLEPPATPEVLAKESGLKLDQVLICLEAMRFLKPEDWNDFACVVHGSWKSHSVAPEAEIEEAEKRQILAESIKKLPERERIVLTLYYSEELNLAEIGRVIEISESRVSRVLAAARFRLKEIVRSQNV